MTPDEIIKGMRSKNQMLTQKNEELIILAEKVAATKRAYAIAYATMMLALKEESKPATLIPDLARGEKTVADLRYNKDVAKGVYDACRESIKDIRAALDSYRSILTFEREEKFNRSV